MPYIIRTWTDLTDTGKSVPLYFIKLAPWTEECSNDEDDPIFSTSRTDALRFEDYDAAVRALATHYESAEENIEEQFRDQIIPEDLI